ncbi:AsmA2 domain-containing protein YhdP [Edaphovirga cremea]|uniref:AsmA2 domain-containing protein YhdP n=1 Tax=Edaphovirga cremea TaxID=2267246 RepID=UPI003988F1E8
MRRVPGILLATCATIIVIVALLISGLRLVLPQIDSFRPQILQKIKAVTGIDVHVARMSGSWQTFGPTLELQQLDTALPKSDLKVQRITLALDVWQSLLHMRWQFRDLTFYNLQLDMHTTLGGQDHRGNTIEPSQVSDIFLKQIDHFDLRNSRISFLTPSGSRAELEIPQLTWLNSLNRHRAEGQISLSSFNGQHGVVQVRMDLHDNQGLLNNGMLYLQADNIDLKPWFGRWLRNNTGLQSADFSLAAWISVKHGQAIGGDALLSSGAANWKEGDNVHRLDVDNLTLHARREGTGWQFDVPALNLKTDGIRWPQGALSALWLPENTQFLGPAQNEELRLRASNIQLERLEPILPAISFLTPNLQERWADLQPKGKINALALDIPMRQPEQIRFQASWQDLSWQHWKLLPGIDHFSGKLSGNVGHGRLDLNLQNSLLPYGTMFRAPLEVSKASGAVEWRDNAQGWEMWSNKLDVQAKSLWINGDFHYQQPAKGEPWLKILAGIRLYDAGNAWRYFPEPLMGKHLVDYLSKAIQAGQVDNASLIYAGNPHLFPYKHNEGQFEVFVPLRKATFEFEPGWPALTNLDIDLDFLNDGLFMKAKQTQLGKVTGKNIAAAIPDYLKQKLLIDADITGEGKEVGNYFMQTPLDDSLGGALEELQVSGEVNGRLHLDIPLDGEKVTASGEVVLNNNGLFIKPLESKMDRLSGAFRFDNGNLTSDTLTANWLGQPVNVNFSTKELEKEYQVGVDLKGDWQPAKLPGLPPQEAKKLSGSVPWNSKVAITLPRKGVPNYTVDVNADLKRVSSYLPAPLDKKAGEPLPLKVNATGNLHGFMLTGSLASKNHFNSQWLLGKEIELNRASWDTDSKKVPPLPENSSLTLDLPALDGESWLALISPDAIQESSSGKVGGFSFPKQVTLTTPQLTLAGQAWHNLTLQNRQQINGIQVDAKGKEIDGTLRIVSNAPWRANIRYLYFNPQFPKAGSDPAGTESASEPLSGKVSFKSWPSLMLRCDSCWFYGQNFGRVEADVTTSNDTLTLDHGLIDTGKARVLLAGRWQQSENTEKTSLKGKLTGAKINDATDWFGVSTPLKDAPFTFEFDLYWQGAPWQPQIATLNGTLNTQLGKGEIDNLGGGRAGQLLRLVSFDALLRKLQFDFRDTFGRGFYFDSIKSTAWIKDGVMHTDDLLIDGLAADIAMSGKIDLVRRQIDMEAVIAPEISATVGVATAFVINPVVGAAVFAATKVLAPLWNKISLIRYQITGSLDHPSINEVLRQPKDNEAK